MKARGLGGLGAIRQALADAQRDAAAAERPALRSRDPRQGKRLAGPRAGVEEQGQELARAEAGSDRVHAGARERRRRRCAAGVARADGTEDFALTRAQPPTLRIQSAV